MNRAIVVAAGAMLLLIAPVNASTDEGTVTQTFAYSFDVTKLDSLVFQFGAHSDGTMFFEVVENGVTALDACQTTDLANTCDGVVAVVDGHSGHAPAAFVIGANGAAVALTGQGVVSTTLVSVGGDDASIVCTFGPPGAIIGVLAYGAAQCTADVGMSDGDFSLAGAKNADTFGTVTHFVVGASNV